jgi:hypothetical protein
MKLLYSAIIVLLLASPALADLVKTGDIEIMLQEDLDDGTTSLLVCDNRRSYEEGEVYEIIV